jgi:hypothetical protein
MSGCTCFFFLQFLPIDILNWLRQWGMIGIAIILPFLPIVNDLLSIFALDIVDGILISLWIHHFQSNHSLYFINQWKYWRRPSSLFSNLFTYGIIGMFMNYVGLGFLRQEFSDLSYQLFIYPIILLSILLYIGFRKLNPKA